MVSVILLPYITETISHVLPTRLELYLIGAMWTNLSFNLSLQLTLNKKKAQNVCITSIQAVWLGQRLQVMHYFFANLELTDLLSLIDPFQRV